MADDLNRLTVALADSYRIEGELGAGGMATVVATKVAARLMSLKRRVGCNESFDRQPSIV